MAASGQSIHSPLALIVEVHRVKEAGGIDRRIDRRIDRGIDVFVFIGYGLARRPSFFFKDLKGAIKGSLR